MEALVGAKQSNLLYFPEIVIATHSEWKNEMLVNVGWIGVRSPTKTEKEMPNKTPWFLEIFTFYFYTWFLYLLHGF